VPTVRPSLVQRLFFALLLCLATADSASARERRTLTIRMPRVSLPAGSNVETCYFLRIPTTSSFMLGSWQIKHAGAKGGTQPQHGLVYLYTGERLDEFPSGQVVQSRACLDFGPEDRDRRVLIASGSAPKTERALPTGVALELAPVPDAPGGSPAGIGILVDDNWSNTEPKARRVATKVILRRVAKGRANRTAHVIADQSANAGILVPPFMRHTTSELVDARWTAPGDVCVLGLTTQMHRRGRCAGVDLLDTGGQVKPPAVTINNPCVPGTSQLFVGVDFTDPGALAFTTPMPVRAGEALRYACVVDNGASAGASVRLGCETSPGVTPGAVGSPATECSVVVPASAECSGNAACVYANAVAGPGVDDEICGITAQVYDAAPGGSCDVSSLP
jgi:hypothetical protein